jgi:hypothetical protein
MKREEYSEIENLIERYFNAETTLEEESLIRKYYRNTPVDEIEPQLRGYAPLFGYFSNEIDALENNLSDTGTEAQPKAGRYREPERVVVKTSFYRPLMRWGTLAAAAVLVVAFFLINPREDNSLKLMIDGERVNNSELAMSFAGERLDKVNEMMGQVKKGNDVMDRLTTVGRAMAPLEKIGTKLTQNQE